MLKKLLKILLVVGLLISVVWHLSTFDVLETEAATDFKTDKPTIYVDPSVVLDLPPSSVFTISVNVFNVTDLYGFDVGFTWNPEVAEYINHSVHIPSDVYTDGVLWNPILSIKNLVNATEGSYWIAYSSMPPAPSFNGSGMLLNMSFRVKKLGSCYLSFTSHDLADRVANPIDHYVQGSYLQYSRPVVHVDPADNFNKSVGDLVTVSLKIFNLTQARLKNPINPLIDLPLGNLFGFGLNFTWDPAVLKYVSHTVTIPVETYPEGVLYSDPEPVNIFRNNVSIDGGSYELAATCMGLVTPFNNPDRSNTVFQMTFNVTRPGASFLRLQEAEFSDFEMKSIPHYRRDYSRGGVFVPTGARGTAIPWDPPLTSIPRDGQIATTGTPWPDFGFWPEDYAVVNNPVVFDASASYDADGSIKEYIWDFYGNNSQTVVGTPIVNHTYTTVGAGRYLVALRVKDDSDLTSLKVIKEVKITSKRELAIGGLATSTAITQNETASVRYTVSNTGSIGENIIVSAYINATAFPLDNLEAANWQLIWSQGFVLSSQRNWSTSFSWTANVTEAYYYIKMNVTIVPYENTEDNSALIDTPVYVTSERIHDMAAKSVAIDVVVQDIRQPPVIVGETIRGTPSLLCNGSVTQTFNVTLNIIAPNGSVAVRLQWMNSVLGPGQMAALPSKTASTSGWDSGNYTAAVNVTIVEVDVRPENDVASVKFRVIRPPVLVVSAAKTIFTNENVTMDATGSTFGDGTIVKYDWGVYEPDGLAYGIPPQFRANTTTYTCALPFTGKWDIVLTVTDSFGITYDSYRPLTSSYRKQAVVTVEERSPWPIDPLYIVIILIVVVVVVGIVYMRLKRSRAR